MGFESSMDRSGKFSSYFVRPELKAEERIPFHVIRYLTPHYMPFSDNQEWTVNAAMAVFSTLCAKLAASYYNIDNNVIVETWHGKEELTQDNLRAIVRLLLKNNDTGCGDGDCSRYDLPERLFRQLQEDKEVKLKF